MKVIGAAKFREQCLSPLENLDPDGLVSTKRGRPVACLLPYVALDQRLLGSLRDRIEVRGNVLSTGLRWDADDQS